MNQEPIQKVIHKAQLTVLEVDFVNGILIALVNHEVGIDKLNAAIGQLEKAKVESTHVHPALWGFVNTLLRGGSLDT